MVVWIALMVIDFFTGGHYRLLGSFKIVFTSSKSRLERLYNGLGGFARKWRFFWPIYLVLLFVSPVIATFFLVWDVLAMLAYWCSLGLGRLYNLEGSAQAKLTVWNDVPVTMGDGATIKIVSGSVASYSPIPKAWTAEQKAAFAKLTPDQQALVGPTIFALADTTFDFTDQSGRRLHFGNAPVGTLFDVREQIDGDGMEEISLNSGVTPDEEEDDSDSAHTVTAGV